MANEQIVLVREADEANYFFTGYGWSEEYPDAWIYTKIGEASKAAKEQQAKAIVRYGYEDQSTYANFDSHQSPLKDTRHFSLVEKTNGLFLLYFGGTLLYSGRDSDVALKLLNKKLHGLI